MLTLLIVVVLLALVLGVVTSPWRRSRRPAPHNAAEQALRRAGAEIIDLETARDAKYQEIRDAELDHETGKLSEADFVLVDRSLRAEAIEILKALDRAHARLERLTREIPDAVTPPPEGAAAEPASTPPE